MAIMDTLIKQLEAQLHRLIAHCDMLTASNAKLREQKNLLFREKELLLTKNKKAVAQLKQLVTHLKMIDENSA